MVTALGNSVVHWAKKWSGLVSDCRHALSWFERVLTNCRHGVASRRAAPLIQVLPNECRGLFIRVRDQLLVTSGKPVTSLGHGYELVRHLMLCKFLGHR